MAVIVDFGSGVEEHGGESLTVGLAEKLEVLVYNIYIGAADNEHLEFVGSVLHHEQSFNFVELDDRTLLEVVEDFVHAVVELLVLASKNVKTQRFGLLALVQRYLRQRPQSTRSRAVIRHRIAHNFHHLSNQFFAGGRYGGGDAAGVDSRGITNYSRATLIVEAECLRGSIIEHRLICKQEHELIGIGVVSLRECLRVKVGNGDVGIARGEVVAKFDELAVDLWLEIPALDESRLNHKIN